MWTGDGGWFGKGRVSGLAAAIARAVIGYQAHCWNKRGIESKIDA
jgi:hypothetical protein